MFARKPLGGWSCASCEKGLINLYGLMAEYYPWNRFPLRDPQDRIARVNNKLSYLSSNFRLAKGSQRCCQNSTRSIWTSNIRAHLEQCLQSFLNMEGVDNISIQSTTNQAWTEIWVRALHTCLICMELNQSLSTIPIWWGVRTQVLPETKACQRFLTYQNNDWQLFTFIKL